MKKLNIAVVGTVGLPACYGGFESLVENLVTGSSSDIHYTVYSSSKSYDEHISYYKGATIDYIPLHANGVQSIPYDIISLIKALFLKPDVVLVLGVSGCLFMPLFRLAFHGLIITNIDGLEWKRVKWGYLTRIFLKLSERLAVKFSDIIVADNEAITKYVESEYNVKAKTIAYGGDHAIVNQDNKLLLKKVEADDYFLSICRIEPENNIEMILEAFSKLPNIKIKFVGNWDNSEYGKEMRRKYSAFSNISIISPIYDISLLYQLRRHCVGYVHGHSAGGTNPSLVEAMHFSKPIYAFDCVFNRYTTKNGCFYFSCSDDLAISLRSKEYLDSKIGEYMCKIANELYTWESIRNKYESLYYLK